MKNFFICRINKFLILELDERRRDEFVNYCVPIFQKNYIRDQRRVEALADKNLEEVMGTLLPTDMKIKSAEFAEINTYCLLPSKTGYDLKGPHKLHWKNDKNIPLQKSDVVLFDSDLGKPSENDLIVVAETKSKSVRKSSMPIMDAILGASKDKIDRLGHTLVWMKDRSIYDKNNDLKNMIERFQNPEKKSYIKHFKAIVFIDGNLLDAELLKNYEDIVDSDIEVFIVSIKQLSDLYNEVYQKVASHV